MKLRIHHYICLIAAIAILFPYSAHAVVGWTFASVKSYGAYGDSLHDDTAAINLAIASDKVVYFPPGTYKYAGPMTLPANSSYRIYGDGPGVSTILFTGPNAGITTTNTAVTTLNVEGLTLMAFSTNCGTAINASFMAAGPKAHTVTIHNVQIVGSTRDGTTGGYWTNGIHLYRATNSVIDKIHIDSNKNLIQTRILYDYNGTETNDMKLYKLEHKLYNH
jgi:polygalacturonase